jgi:hypothetical protein
MKEEARGQSCPLFRLRPSLDQLGFGWAKEIFVGNERRGVARRILQINLIKKVARFGPRRFVSLAVKNLFTGLTCDQAGHLIDER